MIDLMLNANFNCNIVPSCKGCWITEAAIPRDPSIHTAQEWIRAIAQTKLEIRKIEICGGEPLLWDNLLEFCLFSPWEWAITTNLLLSRFLSFVRSSYPKALCFTCTYHPESRLSRGELADREVLLRKAYPGRVNIALMAWSEGATENAAWFRSHGHTVNMEPYEQTPRWLPNPTYTCDGGQSFAFLAPNGDVFPCVDSQRAQANLMGNIFRRDVVWPTERLKCNLECNSWKNLPEHHPSGDVHTLKVCQL